MLPYFLSRRSHLAAGLVATSLALLPGCGQPAGSSGSSNSSTTTPTASLVATGKPIQVELWHYFSQEQARPLNDLVSRFEKENPGIDVRAIYQGNPGQLRQKLDSALATTPPTVPVMATVYENWTSDYVTKGYLDPFQNYIGTPDGFTEADLKDFVTVFREACTYDGKLVTVPFNKSIYMFYLNMTALNAAGITTAPATLEAYGDAIRKATVEENGRVKTYGAGVQPLSEAFSALFLANGGQFFDENNQPQFNTPEALQVMTFLRDIQNPKKHLLVNPDFMSSPFGNQQIAMYIYSSASFPFNKKLSRGPDGKPRFDYQVAPIPTGPSGKEPRYLMQGTNLAIFGQPHSDDTRRAAAKLITYLTGTKIGAEWATRAGYMPFRYSMRNEATLFRALEEDPGYATAARLVLENRGMQEPRMPQWDGFRTELNTMVDRVLNRGADPAEELARIQDTIKDRLATAQARQSR
jgi:multiple sugar transport system substrate-binding protein